MVEKPKSYPLRNWLFKNVINPITISLLRSPANKGIGQFILLLSYKGHKSGKLISHPASYSRDGNRYLLYADGNWWKNFKKQRPVELLILGEKISGDALAYTDPKLIAESILKEYQVLGFEMAQRRHRLKVQKDQMPTIDEIKEQLDGRVLVVVRL